MKDKKQITMVSLLGALAVGVLASVVLGNAYNNSQAQENETEYAAVLESYEPDTISAEHETETEETSEAETEAETTIAEETEPETELETEPEDTAEADETTPETDEQNSDGKAHVPF